MGKMATHADLLTAASCSSLLAQLFMPFGLSMSHVRSVLIPPKTINCDAYRIRIETETAPSSLKTPDDFIGGLQFSFMQKRFVYRFDHYVLSYETVCDESQQHRPWVTSGAMYVMPSVNDARDLIEKLIQFLPQVTGEEGQLQLAAAADVQLV